MWCVSMYHNNIDTVVYRIKSHDRALGNEMAQKEPTSLMRIK